MRPPDQGPPLMWSERGASIGAPPLAPETAADRWAARLRPWLDLAWRALGLLALPFLLLHPRARRFLLDLPAPEPGWIWLHGASAGEHVAAGALAAALPPEVWRTSSSWRTPVAAAMPAPMDLPIVFERWLDRARPRMLILVEAELWPGWLGACRRRGVPVVVVNARAGRGTDRLRRRPILWRWLTEGVRFIGVEETGDLKLAAELRSATFQLGRDAFIGASTRPGDEAALLDALALLPAPRPLLVLAPRHLDRVGEVEAEIRARGLAFRRRTQGVEEGSSEALDVLLLDTIGELGTLYAQARAAFVGGTFDPRIGGHSPAEAFAAGVPVVHGPCTESNALAFNQGIALRVPDRDPARLAGAMRSALAVGPRPAPQNESAVRAAALLPEGHTPDERPERPLLWPLTRPYQVLAAASPSVAGPAVRVSVPVLSVGALVAGGAGKSPAAAWLAERLPGAWVLARGYRRGPGPALRCGLPGQPPEHPLGDELEMMRRRGIPVISAPDRVAGAEEAARRGARLILLDDGFQHRRLARDLDVVCIDARWPEGRGLIPVGSRREPWSALERANFLWISHASRPGAPPGADPLPEALRAAVPALRALPEVRARLTPVGWLHRGEKLPLSARRGTVDAIVGLARPEGFVCALLGLGLSLRSLRVLPDHGPISSPAAGAVMTEKDAARLPPDADVWALRVELRVSGEAPLLAAARALLARP